MPDPDQPGSKTFHTTPLIFSVSSRAGEGGTGNNLYSPGRTTASSHNACRGKGMPVQQPEEAGSNRVIRARLSLSHQDSSSAHICRLWPSARSKRYPRFTRVSSLFTLSSCRPLSCNPAPIVHTSIAMFLAGQMLRRHMYWLWQFHRIPLIIKPFFGCQGGDDPARDPCFLPRPWVRGTGIWIVSMECV